MNTANEPPKKESPDLLALNAGDTFQGRRIQHIYARHNLFIVFSHDGDDWFKYHVQGLELSPLAAHSQIINRLVMTAKRWIPKEQIQNYVAAIAALWADCLRNHKTPLPITCWDSIAADIENEASDRAKTFHLAAAILSAVVCVGCVSVALFFCPATKPNLNLAMKAAICGCCGATASILFRSSLKGAETYRTKLSAIAQGFCRAVIGLFFGAFTYAAVQGGLFLSLAKDSPFLVWSFTFISGFSERFVPDAIESAQAVGKE